MSANANTVAVGLVAALAWLLWWRTMANGSDAIVRGLLVAIALVCLAPVVDAYAKHTPFSSRTYVLIGAILLLVGLALLWPH